MVQPEQSFQHGTCRASIFVNKINKNGKEMNIKKVVVSKRYKTKDGDWKTSSSLDMNDVPKMIAALTSAYMYLTKTNTTVNPNMNANSESAPSPDIPEEYVQ